MTSTIPKILVHEYFSGGGWLSSKLPSDLAGEGLAMLQSVLRDFREWGGAETITTLDHRLSRVSLPAETVVYLEAKDHVRVLERLSKQCDAALIIAPETNSVLAHLCTMVKDYGASLLGSSPAAIGIAGNKWECHRRFRDAGLPTPETKLVYVGNAPAVAGEMGFPLVTKPVDGVGCEAINLISNTASLLMVLDKNGFSVNGFLIQQYVQGDHASVSLLMDGTNALCLSANRQFIAVGMPFAYHGGEIPYDGERCEEAIALAKSAVTLIPGLKGYVGVDLVITAEGCQIVEINPRLTTSYVGLRRVVNINLAESIWDAVMHDRLPEQVTLSEGTRFTKEGLYAA